MKKIYTIAILMLTLLSCFVFSACGNKYKKLSLDFYLEGSTVSSVNFLLDDDNDFQDQMTIGLKVSGVKQQHIKDIIFEFPNTIGTLTNQYRDGKMFYITLTVTSPVENKEVYLKAIHPASGKSKSLRVVVDQKANDVEMLADKYIISVPKTGRTNHVIDINSLVRLLPAGSTDKILFKSSAPINKNHITPIYEGEFIKGFEVSSSLTEKVELSGIYPVTILNGEDEAFTTKMFTVVFIPTLSAEDLLIVSDAKHMVSGYLYDPIYLIANDANKATDDYNYNNFYVQLQYHETGTRDTFINGYAYSEFYDVEFVSAPNITMTFNEYETKAFIQAKNMNERTEEVKIHLTPKDCVGDIKPVELSINAKADIKPKDLILKKGNNEVIDNKVDIYDVYTGNKDSQMLSFSPELPNSLEDLHNVRLQVPIGFLEIDTHSIYTDSTFTSEYTDHITGAGLNEKLLIIYKNGASSNALKFYYDGNNAFISEPISKNDKIFVKYVGDPEAGSTLSMKVFNYYSGDHDYLETIGCLEEEIFFNSKLGVNSANFAMGQVSFLPLSGNLDFKTAENDLSAVYVDKNESISKYKPEEIGSKSINKYALQISEVSGVGGNIPATTFEVEIITNDGQSNPIRLESKELDGNDYTYGSSNSVEDYLFLKLDGFDTGRYTLNITHDSGYQKSINIYVYDSSVVTSSALKVSGSFIDNRSNTYVGYGDYIVASGEKLTIDVDHNVPSWQVEKYEYSATIADAIGIDMAEYFKLSAKGKMAELTCLKGTYNEGIKKITLTSKVTYKSGDDNLQLTEKTEQKVSITIFVYEKIEESDFEINYSEVDVYSLDLLGLYDQTDSQKTLEITLPIEDLWNYTQKIEQNSTDHKIGKDGDRNVVWFVNDTFPLSTESQGDKHIGLQFSGSTAYDVAIYVKIKQFDKVFDHLSCIVHVRKPIITTSLNVEFTKGENKEIEIKDDTLNIRDGVEYTMNVENLANSSVITNKNSFAVVVNGSGEVENGIVELKQDTENLSKWKINLNSTATLRDDLRLIVFAKDAMGRRVTNYTNDLIGSNIQDYLLTGHKDAYKEYKLVLSDGSIGNRYWIECADDFWEIKDNENLQSKHFELRNNINLKNTTYSTGVIDNFSGSIVSSCKVVEVVDIDMFNEGIYYIIDGDKFVIASSYDSTATYYAIDNYYSMYGLELNNNNKNLIENLSGSISGVQFITKYNYDLTLDTNIDLGIIGKNIGTLNNVSVSVSGQGRFTNGGSIANFGALVGTNNGSIKIIDKNIVGMTGEISLSGDGIVQFGAIAGQNAGTITGVIAEDSLLAHEFSIAFADQGAISNLTINSTLNHAFSAIGGVVGLNTGKIRDLFVTGEIKASTTSNVGGVVGKNKTTENKAEVSWSGTSYMGVELSTDTSKYDLVNIKSSVEIQAKDNVGGIVGQDLGGNYYYCRYQIVADVQKHGIEANENVGGIAGSSEYGKFIYCSVYGYRWVYAELDSTFNGKNADIYGKKNVGGIVGWVKLENYTQNELSSGITAVRQSSVNAYVQSYNNAGEFVGVVSGEHLPVDTVYFMGKLSGESISTEVDTINYYHIYINKSEDPKIDEPATKPSGSYWGTDSSVNAGEPYILYNGHPIFDLAPNSVDATAKDSAGRVTKVNNTMIHIDFYQTKLSVLHEDYQETQDTIDQEFNIYNFNDLFDFTCIPAGSYRFKVSSSNAQVAEIMSNGQLKIKGIGVAVITFTSVLNSSATCEVTIEVNYPMNTSYVISNSASNSTIGNPENLATGQAKQYYVHENNDSFEYRTNTELGYIVNIALEAGKTLPSDKEIRNYIKVSGQTYSDNMIVAPGRRLTFELIDSVDTTFVVKVTPFVLGGVEPDTIKLAGTELTFNLSTKQGVSDIKLNYSNIKLYPNDEIIVTATFTTDKKLVEDDVRGLASSDNDYLAVSYVEGSLPGLVKPSGSAIGTQTAKYKITVADNAKYLTELAKVEIKVATNGVESIAKFKLLAQRIDNIDIKNYSTSRQNGVDTPDDISDDTYKIEALSRILRPNYSGLLVLDVVPSNGQFDYIEITDVTGSEEILFTQVDCDLGEQIEGYTISGESLNAERIEKGIRLVGKNSRYYVMTRISKDYTSRIHTIKVTARLSDGTEVASTYHYIDVKMMPSVTMEYYDPNGIRTAESIDNDDAKLDLNNNRLYLANGVNSVDFRITTKNSDGNIDTSLAFDDWASHDANEYFELVKGQRDNYELNFKKYDESINGKTLTITATTRATMDNGTVEYESTSFKFIITEFVIHNISVNNSKRISDYNYELYGDYNVPIDLSFYFDKTDISFFNNGNPFTQTYVYKSAEYDKNINKGTTIDKIYQILRELNSNPSSYIKLNSSSSWQDIAGGIGKYIATSDDEITLTRNNTTDTLTLKVVEENIVQESNMEIVFKYKYSNNTIVTSDQDLSLTRNYSFNFTNRTSLFNMTAINNEEEFLEMKSSDTGYYILNADLELGKRGTSTYEKYGSYSPLNVDIAMFDGNGHTIKIYSFAEFGDEAIQAGLFKQIRTDMIVMNLNVEYVSQNDGSGNWSFGRISPSVIDYADICDLGEESKIDYTSVQFGGITPVNKGIVTNCKVSGRIALHASTLENSSNNKKDINFNIGGLIGTNSGYITHSVSELQVYALANIGGLVYENTVTGKIASSYFDAQENKGAIFAYPDVNSDATNAIETMVAGFVVNNLGEISMSYSSIGLNKTLNPSGIGAMTIKDSSAGFAYSNSGQIKDCYVTQLVLGQSNNTFYGFVFRNSGRIQTSYTFVNEGGWNDKVRLFAPSGTTGLTDCIEFISTDVGYTIKSEGLHRITNRISGILQYDKMETYTEYNFNFGDNENSIWIIESSATPKLVSTLSRATGCRMVTNITETLVDENGREYENTRTELSDNGYGSKENPYVIYDLTTWDHYMKLNEDAGQSEIRSYYRIVADIDFSLVSKNLPTTQLSFSGNIQGNNMTIRGFTIYSEESLPAIGLFKEIKYTNAREITPAIRNIHINANSVLAVKTEVVGVLAGYIENYHLYNISVSCDETVLGGNVVGGLAGVISGDLEMEDISSSVSVNATKHTVGGLYDMYISKTNGGKEYQNINKVNFAGSVAGMVDAFDGSIFELTRRDIDGTGYKTIKKVSVEGSITAIGENVGGMFGFVGERVKLTDATITISGGKITGRRYAGMAVAENRGVLINVQCSTTDEDLFKDSNYMVGGAVGMNFGGYIANAQADVDIIKMTANNTVGGVVGRNVDGTVVGSTYIGKLFGNIMGGVIGVDNKIETLKNSGTISADSLNLSFKAYEKNGIDTTNSIGYKQGGLDVENYQNCSISIETFNYWLENMNKVYRYSIDIDNDLQPRAIRCLGLFIGRSIITSINGIEIGKIDSFVDNKSIDILKFTTSMATTVELGEYEKGSGEDKELWLRSIPNAKMSSSIDFSFIETSSKVTIPVLDISQISSEYVKNNELYLLTIVGRCEDSFDSWDGEIGNSDYYYNGRIFCLNIDCIKDEKIGNLAPGSSDSIDPGTEAPPSEGSSYIEPEGGSSEPPGTGYGGSASVIVSGSELFNPIFANIANGTNTTFKFDDENDIISWIDYIGYNRIKDEIWIEVEESLVIDNNKLDDIINKKTFAGFNYLRNVSGNKLYVSVRFDIEDQKTYTKSSLPNATATRIFAVDSYENVIDNVSTSDQLTYIFERNALNNENKFKPNCVANSMADKVYRAAKNILALICTDEDSEYIKAKKIYEWICTNVTYDNSTLNKMTQTTPFEKYRCFFAEGALIDRYAVCDGMSKAYAIMCGIEGISCIRIDGFPTDSNLGHAWNQIKLGSNWYHIDPTNYRYGWVTATAQVLGGNTYTITDIDLQSSVSAFDIFSSDEYKYDSEDILIESNTEDDIYDELIELFTAFKTSMGILKYGYIEFKDVENSVNLAYNEIGTQKNNIYYCITQVFGSSVEVNLCGGGYMAYDVNGKPIVWMLEIILS